MDAILQRFLCLFLFVSCVSSNDVIKNKIEEFVNGYINCTDTIGVSLSVVNEGKEFLTGGYGLKKLEGKEKMTEETMFFIGSISKGFVSTLMAKTIEMNPRDLSWDSKVHDLLPDFYFNDPVATREATITDLLVHRVGLYGHNVMRIAGFSMDELMERIRYLEFRRSFRDGYRYNNLMYGVASYILQRVHERDNWEDVAKEFLLSPLNMTYTAFISDVLAEDRLDEFARGYSKDGQEFREVPIEYSGHYYYGTITAPGGIASNAIDMAKWIEFVLSAGKSRSGEQLVDAQLLRQTHIPKNVRTNTPPIRRELTQYDVTKTDQKGSMGWREGYYKGYELHSHSGSTGAFTMWLHILPKQQMGVYLGINGPAPARAREHISLYILDLLLGDEPLVDLDYVCSENIGGPDIQSENQRMAKGQKRQKRNLNQNANNTFDIEGTYGHFGYGNLTIYLNDDDDLYYMRYGKDALFVMEQTDTDRYTATGADVLWIDSYRMRFSVVDGKEQVEMQFQGYIPFVKGLKQSEAPPIPVFCPAAEPDISKSPMFLGNFITNLFALVSLVVIFS